MVKTIKHILICILCFYLIVDLISTTQPLFQKFIDDNIILLFLLLIYFLDKKGAEYQEENSKKKNTSK